jgi:phosphohistidine phosphatase
VKQLILLRHAKSSWTEPELADHERPLSGRGERDAPLIGGRLRARQAQPSLIITSDAKRAVRTARIIASILEYPRESLRIESALYLAPPAIVLDVVGAQDQSHASLMIVGHNPGLTELANRLLPDLNLDNLPTAGVLAIDFDTQHWSELAGARATVAYYDYPKNRLAVVR